MKPFRERRPVPIAIICMVVLIVGVIVAFEAPNLPLIGGGAVYHADFADVGGLLPGDDVRVAGVKVGSVTGIRLDGDQAEVTMRVNHGTLLTSGTRASIQLETVLGQEYIDLQPEGTGNLTATIPLSRTSVPLTVPAAFQGFASRVEKINTGRLERALDTIAATFRGSPPYVTAALKGLTRLSATVYTRDQQLSALLASANKVTGTLAGRDHELTGVINDGDVVLRLLESQRAQVHALLVNSISLANQLSGLVSENRATLAPALTNLHGVVALLQRDQTQLGQTVELLGPYARLANNAVSSGRFFNSVISNLSINKKGTLLLQLGSGAPPFEVFPLCRVLKSLIGESCRK